MRSRRFFFYEAKCIYIPWKNRMPGLKSQHTHAVSPPSTRPTKLAEQDRFLTVVPVSSYSARKRSRCWFVCLLADSRVSSIILAVALVFDHNHDHLHVKKHTANSSNVFDVHLARVRAVAVLVELEADALCTLVGICIRLVDLRTVR